MPWARRSQGATGSVGLFIPIPGSEGEATIYAVGKKRGETWFLDKLEVRVHDTGKVINVFREAKRLFDPMPTPRTMTNQPAN